MYLEAFSDNPFGTNCWLVSSDGRDEAVIVDPGFEAARVRATLEEAGKRPAAVLATHGHYDHVGAAAELAGDDIPCFIHQEDALAFTDPGAWGAGFPVPTPKPKDLRTFSDGDTLDLAGFSLQVMHTPGHTPGSSCFRTEDLVFTGDLVFRGAIGRYDFPNSSATDMFASLRRFLTLPDPLPVYPGHGDTTTVALERASNPFLRQLA
jgi:hydroxyacylglutathione hydrolase